MKMGRIRFWMMNIHNTLGDEGSCENENIYQVFREDLMVRLDDYLHGVGE